MQWLIPAPWLALQGTATLTAGTPARHPRPSQPCQGLVGAGTQRAVRTVLGGGGEGVAESGLQGVWPMGCRDAGVGAVSRVPTLLSLALMQTWLCVYSLLNVCVRRRRHCGDSERPVRSLPGPGPADGWVPNNRATGREAWHCRSRWPAPQASRKTG